MNRKIWIEKTRISRRRNNDFFEYSFGRALWSPQKDRGGNKKYENMNSVQINDIVLHLDLDDHKIKGISLVDSACDQNFKCLKGTERDHNGDRNTPGYLVRLKNFINLDEPI